MATSGTVGQTVFKTREVIDFAARAYRKPPALLTGEQLDSALKHLWLILTEFASHGAPVWKIRHEYLPLYANTPYAVLPVGAVEMSGANLVSVTRVTDGTPTTDGEGTAANAFDDDTTTAVTHVSAARYIDLEFTEAQNVVAIGVLPAASGTWDFSLQLGYSDGRDPLTIKTFDDEQVYEGRWLWAYVPLESREKFARARIQASGTTVLNVSELYVGADATFAGTLAPYNKDEYFSLPNKNQVGTPNLFWQDVRRDQTFLRLWPVPGPADVYKHLEVLAHQEIEDIGTLRQSLDIPNRFFDAVIRALAERMADEDPDFKGDINRLERKAAEARRTAFAGITAKGSINIVPNIRGYTRG